MLINKPNLPEIQIPPGYRFNPTDLELVRDYLMKKVNNEPLPIAGMHDTNLLFTNPQALSESYPKIGDDKWYFFSPLTKKYPRGDRPDLAGDNGYWKPNGGPTPVEFEGRIIGKKRSMKYYEGPRDPKGTRTNWSMCQFRVYQPTRTTRSEGDMRLEDWALCQIYQGDDDGRRRGRRRGRGDAGEVSSIGEGAAVPLPLMNVATNNGMILDDQFNYHHYFNDDIDQPPFGSTASTSLNPLNDDCHGNNIGVRDNINVSWPENNNNNNNNNNMVVPWGRFPPFNDDGKGNNIGVRDNIVSWPENNNNNNNMVVPWGGIPPNLCNGKFGCSDPLCCPGKKRWPKN